VEDESGCTAGALKSFIRGVPESAPALRKLFPPFRAAGMHLLSRHMDAPSRIRDPCATVTTLSSYAGVEKQLLCMD
jgi:hypothetical protein